jgi:hypothetical protein
MSRLLVLAAAGMIAVAVPSSAQTPAVDAARQAGQVGERFDGYLGASRRVAPYEVAIAAGCQLLARVQVGQAYMLADGRWRVRASGQPAPIPQYCR